MIERFTREDIGMDVSPVNEHPESETQQAGSDFGRDSRSDFEVPREKFPVTADGWPKRHQVVNVLNLEPNNPETLETADAVLFKYELQLRKEFLINQCRTRHLTFQELRNAV